MSPGAPPETAFESWTVQKVNAKWNITWREKNVWISLDSSYHAAGIWLRCLCLEHSQPLIPVIATAGRWAPWWQLSPPVVWITLRRAQVSTQLLKAKHLMCCGMNPGLDTWEYNMQHQAIGRLYAQIALRWQKKYSEINMVTLHLFF